jgi:2-methylcitrate dehydratase PrpD
LAQRLLRGGNGFWDWREEDLGAADIADFATRVTTVVDPVAEDERRDNMGTLVRVTTRDGRVFEERQRYSKGLPENPMSDGEFRAKFDSLAVPQLGSRSADEIAGLVENLAHSDDVSALVRASVRAAN